MVMTSCVGMANRLDVKSIILGLTVVLASELIFPRSRVSGRQAVLFTKVVLPVAGKPNTKMQAITRPFLSQSMILQNHIMRQRHIAQKLQYHRCSISEPQMDTDISLYGVSVLSIHIYVSNALLKYISYIFYSCLCSSVVDNVNV